MKTIKNTIFIILAILAIVLFLAGIFMLTNGSLEAFPTEEHLEKVRICGWIFTVVGTVLEAIFVTVIYKNNRSHKS